MKKQEPTPQDVLIPSRTVKSVTCPHCWTDQRTERDFCYHCGAAFHYQDEEQHTKAG